MEQIWADTRQVTDYGHLIMSWQGHMAIGPSVTLNMQTNVEVSNPKAKMVYSAWQAPYWCEKGKTQPP